MSGRGLSSAAAGLLRALVARSGATREQVLLGDVRSTEWRSLTFSGERHRIVLRITGPHAAVHAERLIHRLEDSEFSIPGVLVADIVVTEGSSQQRDGSVAVTLEALTVEGD